MLVTEFRHSDMKTNSLLKTILYLQQSNSEETGDPEKSNPTKRPRTLRTQRATEELVEVDYFSRFFQR